MTKRRNIGGRYVEVRERSTSKGARGTIMKNWSSKREMGKTYPEPKSIIATIVIIVLILMLIYYLIFYYF